MEHNKEEIRIINKFIKNYNGTMTIYVLRDFIKDNLGITWNTADKQTKAYLEKLIQSC